MLLALDHEIARKPPWTAEGDDFWHAVRDFISQYLHEFSDED